jgi:predicted RNA-binding Zn-ribbon protein involved in translation (DUF1610 family)
VENGAGPPAADVPDVVTARAFRLVDADGKVRAVLAMVADRPILDVLDAAGEVRARFGAAAAGPMLSLLGAARSGRCPECDQSLPPQGRDRDAMIVDPLGVDGPGIADLGTAHSDLSGVSEPTPEPAEVVRNGQTISKCIECGKAMDAAEARVSYTCHICQQAGLGDRVRTLNRRGTDEIGRNARDTKVLGGSAEMSAIDDGDEQ